MKGYCIGSSIGKCGVPHYVVLQCSLDMFDLLQLHHQKKALLSYEYYQYSPLLQFCCILFLFPDAFLPAVLPLSFRRESQD